MSTLFELRTKIDDGKEAVLFLSHDHPGNEEGEDLKIFITSITTGQYRRKLHYINRPHWSSPRSDAFTWEELINGSNGAEVMSDEWTLSTHNA